MWSSKDLAAMKIASGIIVLVLLSAIPMVLEHPRASR
jgi:hypothetical protein